MRYSSTQPIGLCILMSTIISSSTLNQRYPSSSTVPTQADAVPSPHTRLSSVLGLLQYVVPLALYKHLSIGTGGDVLSCRIHNLIRSPGRQFFPVESAIIRAPLRMRKQPGSSRRNRGRLLMSVPKRFIHSRRCCRGATRRRSCKPSRAQVVSLFGSAT